MAHRAAVHVAGGLVATAVLGAVALFTATSLPASATSVSGATPVTTEATANDPSIASDGTDFLVVWTQTVSNALEVYAAQVNGDGSLVKPAFAVSATGDGKNDYRPTVAWNGSKYLIAWQHDFSPTDTDILGRVVTRAGFIFGGTRSISTPTSNQTAPSVTARGTTFLVVWADDRNAGSSDIFRGRVDNDGAVLDGGGVQVTSGTTTDYAPDVASDRNGYMVVFQRQSGSTINLYAQLLTESAGLSNTPFPISTSSDVEEAPKVASNGTTYVVVWNQANAGNVLGAWVERGEHIVVPLTISTATGTQDLPDIAFNGSYLVAWRDSRSGSSQAFATRVTSDRDVLDPNGFGVDPGPGIVGGPAVAPAPGGKWAVAVDHFSGGGITQRIAASK